MGRRAAAGDGVLRHRTNGEEPGLGDIAVCRERTDKEVIEGMSVGLLSASWAGERGGNVDGGRDGHVELTPLLPRPPRPCLRPSCTHPTSELSIPIVPPA